MGVGASIFLIALGLILALAVDINLSGLDLQLVGWILAVIGVVGLLMRLIGFSPAALILALVLGPMAEEALRQSLTISRGSFMIFLERPASLWIVGLSCALLLLVPIMRRFQSED